MKTVRIGLAGCGFIGCIHARSLVLVKGSTLSQKVRLEFVAVADIEVDRAQRLADQYGWKHAVSDWRDLFEYDLDLIIVALPNAEHTDIVQRAAKDGVAVLLEKPMASTYDESLNMYKAAKDNDRIRVGYMNRFVPAVQQAKMCIEAGEIGSIRMVRSVYLLNMRRPGGPEDWRFDARQAGHGASDDLGSHHVDLLRFLVGDITAVQAMTKTWEIRDAPKASNDDAMNALMSFKDGTFGTLSASRTSPGHPLTGYIEIDGEKGTLRIDRACLNDLFVRSQTGVVLQRNARPVEPFVTMWASPTVQGAHPFGWYDCFAFQMAEMVGMAAGLDAERLWSASLEDGIRTMAVTEAMIQAAHTGELTNVGAVAA